jgi:hypothetical protein
MRVLLIIVSLILIAAAANASTRPARETVKGKLTAGTLETVIETADGTMYFFATKDRIGKRIIATCNDPDQLCEVDAMVDDQEIIKVIRVRKAIGP